MSNSLAVATVTEALRVLIDDALADLSGNTSVGRPPATVSAPTGPLVNICLYNVEPSAARRNLELPTRRADGTVSDRPALALDLHYVLSFYGSDELNLQLGMGSVLTALHTTPALTPALVTRVVTNTTALAASDLARALERVRLTLRPLTVEELSKLWSVLFQVPFTPSIAIVASTVLLEPALRPSSAAPVRAAAVSVETLRFPRLDGAERVRAADTETRAVRAGDRLRLSGARLHADPVEVRIGDAVATPVESHDDWLEVDLATATGLRAGQASVYVVHPQPPHDRGGITSGTVALAIHPRITTPVSVAAGVLSITVDLPLAPSQRVYALLNGTSGTVGAVTYDADARTADTNTATFQVPGLAGTWLVRILVDGAESLLETGGGGRYNAPTVTV